MDTDRSAPTSGTTELLGFDIATAFVEVRRARDTRPLGDVHGRGSAGHRTPANSFDYPLDLTPKVAAPQPSEEHFQPAFVRDRTLTDRDEKAIEAENEAWLAERGGLDIQYESLTKQAKAEAWEPAPVRWKSEERPLTYFYSNPKTISAQALPSSSAFSPLLTKEQDEAWDQVDAWITEAGGKPSPGMSLGIDREDGLHEMSQGDTYQPTRLSDEAKANEIISVWREVRADRQHRQSSAKDVAAVVKVLAEREGVTARAVQKQKVVQGFREVIETCIALYVRTHPQDSTAELVRRFGVSERTARQLRLRQKTNVIS